MKTFKKMAVQGDVLFTKIDDLPAKITEEKSGNGKYIIAHSETGHHHTMLASRVKLFRADDDAFVGYLAVNEETPITHERGFDTHESIMFKPGNYKIHRQREYTPEGYRKAAD